MTAIRRVGNNPVTGSDDGGHHGEDLQGVLGTISAGLDYPMIVVTAGTARERAGCVVGFTTQCSNSPFRFVVWISKQNHTFRVARQADALAVHFLAADQRPLAELFGTLTGDEDDKFSRCRWHQDGSGAAILDDCKRWFVGTILSRHDGGDHVGFLLEPTDGRAGPWAGQLGFQMVRDLSPGHPA